MWESLNLITLCYVTAQIVLILGYRQTALISLSPMDNLTITPNSQ